MKKLSSLVILLSVLVTYTQLQAQTPEMARIKAIFILNFIKYSDHQAANDAEEFIVGIYQDEKLQQELNRICGNSYHGKRVVVKQINDLSSPVHLLFVPEQYNYSFLAYTKKKGNIPNTLIVTDINTEKTMINFEVHDSKFCFRLNEPLLASNGIKIATSLRAIAINR